MFRRTCGVLVVGLTLWCAGLVGVAGADTITEHPTVGTPVGITAGPDGALWFTEFFTNKIGRITTAGVITEFVIPTASSQPFGITAGPTGVFGVSDVWFTEASGNKIGRITTAGAITEFALPTAGSNPSGITAGPDGALWFTEASGNKIGRITTGGAITELVIPTAGSNPSGITAGPDGALWFTEASGNKIGTLAPDQVWTEVPGGGLTLSSPAVGLAGSILHLVVRGIDSRIYLNSRRGVSWSGWSEVSGGGLTPGLTPSQPAVRVNGPGPTNAALRLFVQGIDNKIYRNLDEIWIEVPGDGLTLSGPAAVLDGGLTRLFVRGLDNRVYTIHLR